jgi:hypothetical protein
MKRVVFFLLGFLIGGGGCIAGLAALRDVRHARQSAEWPTVEGRIIESKVHRWGTDASGDVSYDAIIRYTYTVDNTVHQNNIVSYGMGARGNRQRAQQIVSRYPRGATRRVYYHPDRPEISVLEPGAGGSPWVGIAVGGVFLIIGLLIIRFLAFATSTG